MFDRIMVRWMAPFALAAFVNMLGAIIGDAWLIYVTKPLLMPLLAGWLYQRTRTGAYPMRNLFLAGLLFSTLGDILLMFKGETWFLAGLGAFLCAHLCYIRAFWKVRPLTNGFMKQQPWWVLAYAAYAVLLMAFLWNGIPAPMRAPVAVYAGVITVMALSAGNLRGFVPADAAQMLLFGSLLFVLSDSLIAVNKFGLNFEADARVGIMITYIFGQWLLTNAAAEVTEKSETAA